MIIKVGNMQRGMTLIELMVAIAILSILATLAWPNYQRYVQKSKQVEVQSILMEVAHQLASYKLVNQSFQDFELTYIAAVASADYDIQLSDVYQIALNQPESDSRTWMLVATPKTTSGQKGTGKITLTHSGIKCWYKQQDQAQVYHLKKENAQVIVPHCPEAWVE